LKIATAGAKDFFAPAVFWLDWIFYYFSYSLAQLRALGVPL